MVMFGFCRRSLVQLYHSLTDELITAGRCRVDGCVRFSMFRIAASGPHVLFRKLPPPRNVLWYQDHSFAFVVNAETWNPKNPPPFCMYCWNPARCAAECGRSSRNMTTWYWDRVPLLASMSQFCVAV